MTTSGVGVSQRGSVMTIQTPAAVAAAAGSAAVAGPILTYLVEQRRRVHMAREVLQREQLGLAREHAEAWRYASVAQEVREAEAVERWLDRALQEARS